MAVTDPGGHLLRRDVARVRMGLVNISPSTSSGSLSGSPSKGSASNAPANGATEK